MDKAAVEASIIHVPRSLPEIKVEAKKEGRRKLAASLEKQLSKKTFASAHGKKISKKAYLSKMLSELSTNGVTHTLEGEELKPSSFKEWLDLVKFIHSHLEGPAPQQLEVDHQISFKVYAGIDVDRL